MLQFWWVNFLLLLLISSDPASGFCQEIEEKEKENGHKVGPCTKSFGEELSELLALPLSVRPPLLSSSLALCDHELQSLSAKNITKSAEKQLLSPALFFLVSTF